MNITTALHRHLGKYEIPEELCCNDIATWLKLDRLDCPPPKQQPNIDEAILAIDEALAEC